MTNRNNRCEEAISQLINRMEDPNFSEAEFKSFLNVNVSCSDVLQEKYSLWSNLKNLEVPEPSSAMSDRFYEALDLEMSVVEKPKVMPLNKGIVRMSYIKRWSAIAAVFVIGILGGKYLLDRNDTVVEEPRLVVENTVDNTTYVNYNVANSASERLKEVQNIGETKTGTERIFEALNQALLTDPNVNVRLSAIESMLHFSDDPKIREYLILAIPKQESPTVQIALADAMLLLQEKRSKTALDELLDSDNVEMDVKLHIQESINELY